MIQGKKLSIYLMIMQKLDLKLFMKQNRMKQNKMEQDLKYKLLKKMLQRLPIAVAHVKAGNNSEKLLNKIRQIVCSLYQSKEITKNLYNNIIKSIQL